MDRHEWIEDFLDSIRATTPDVTHYGSGATIEGEVFEEYILDLSVVEDPDKRFAVKVSMYGPGVAP